MALPDLFKTKGGLACLRPGNVQELVHKPEHADEKPQLLCRLIGDYAVYAKLSACLMRTVML